MCNCLIECNERNESQLRGSATGNQSCCLSAVNTWRKDAFYRCVVVVLFTSLCRDAAFYPVSSMMQPSQASGHLQSPVKKIAQMTKGDSVMEKQQQQQHGVQLLQPEL